MANLITHIVKQEPPKSGFRKVAFYTIDTDNLNSSEYFLGTDNNPLDSEYIENLVLKKKIIRLINPVEIKDNLLYCYPYLNPSSLR